METSVHFPHVLAVGKVFEQHATPGGHGADDLFRFALGHRDDDYPFDVEIVVVVESRIVDDAFGEALVGKVWMIILKGNRYIGVGQWFYFDIVGRLHDTQLDRRVEQLQLIASHFMSFGTIKYISVGLIA